MITALKPGPLAPIASGPVPVELLHGCSKPAADSPDAIAVWQLGEYLTYGELDRASNALARRLREGGVKLGDHVGLLLPRSTEVYVALLANLKAGDAYVPLDPEYPPDRVRYILDDCRAHSLITLPEFAETYDGFNGTRTSRLRSIVFRRTPPRGRDRGRALRVCYVIYTSGTTGRPKGVQIEHRSACHLVRASRRFSAWAPPTACFKGFRSRSMPRSRRSGSPFIRGGGLVVGPRDDANRVPRWRPNSPRRASPSSRRSRPC